MCIIVVAPRVLKDIPEREPSEAGRGFALVYADEIRVVKSLDAARANRLYRNMPAPLLTIAHCRWPTGGELSELNVQPFASRTRAFAHNGMLDSTTIALLQYMMPDLVGASDSRLLWEVIQSGPYERVARLLFAIRQRFVLADVAEGRVLLLGGWKWHPAGYWHFGWREYVELSLTGQVLRTVPPPDWYWLVMP